MATIDEVLATVDSFDAALRARDLRAAVATWALHRQDVSILGSAAGEVFIGPAAVRACLAALTSRPTCHGWRWVDRRVSVRDGVAWLVADAPWQSVQPDSTVTERPYRVTGVLVQDGHGWQWCQYHGSEPYGSVG
jgi:ketosteroid isomerase-like protein